MRTVDFLTLSSRSLVTKTSRTLLTVLGMGVGIGAVLFLVSLGFGLRNVLIDAITTDKSFVILDVTSRDTQTTPLTQQDMTRIRDIKGVRGISSVKDISAQARFDSLTSEVQIHAVPAHFFALSGLNSAITKGRAFKEKEADSIVITGSLEQLFDDNGISTIGKNVDVTVEVQGADGVAKQITHAFRVIGVLGDTAENVMYMHDANFETYTTYSLIKVETVNSSVLKEVRQNILDLGYEVSSISDTVEQANKIFSVITTVLAIFGIIALTVSAIGMFNTMTITLLERTAEIGVMKSIGASKMDVIKLFVSEAVIMGFLGSVVGVVIGIGGAKLINIVFNSFAVRFGGDAVQLFYTPPIFIVGIIIFGALIGFITGIFPARHASKIDALEALRYK